MEILHVSAECYPVAKAGGLGDVVGALPKYQRELGHIAKVIMPMYRTKFLDNNQWEVVHKGYTHLHNYWFNYTVIREATGKLGFELYLVDINGLLDREKIYGYSDDTERFFSFQIAVTDWLNSWDHTPDVVHVHDHHTALIPFMFKYCFAYRKLQDVGTVLTIHNAQYQGQTGMDKTTYIPEWDVWKRGLLEWEGALNPLACGIRCAWKVTTVSPTYLQEMRHSAMGLEPLLEYEKGKCSGILNGIDTKVWDPATDHYIEDHYNAETVEEGKQRSKETLCFRYGLDPRKPLITFIGRLVGDKGADLLPQAIEDSFYYIGRRMCFLILGSGLPFIEGHLQSIREMSRGDYNTYIGYDEGLSHLIYAGADFILMPSRVEPCGLNQLYALRYGTVPVVRNTGGLHDTVIDYGDPDGYGIRFIQPSVQDMTHAIWRSTELFQNREMLRDVRQRMMGLDFSWEASVKAYLDLYQRMFEGL
ncbi:MAG TPA: glycogen synthase [Puia sp.]|jgi:starch synthase|nr:glycogen synthase [Puia sp.]